MINYYNLLISTQLHRKNYYFTIDLNIFFFINFLKTTNPDNVKETNEVMQNIHKKQIWLVIYQKCFFFLIVYTSISVIKLLLPAVHQFLLKFAYIAV